MSTIINSILTNINSILIVPLTICQPPSSSIDFCHGATTRQKCQAIDQDPDGGVETCGLCWSGMEKMGAKMAGKPE